MQISASRQHHPTCRVVTNLSSDGRHRLPERRLHGRAAQMANYASLRTDEQTLGFDANDAPEERYNARSPRYPPTRCDNRSMRSFRLLRFLLSHNRTSRYDCTAAESHQLMETFVMASGLPANCLYVASSAGSLGSLSESFGATRTPIWKKLACHWIASPLGCTEPGKTVCAPLPPPPQRTSRSVARFLSSTSGSRN